MFTMSFIERVRRLVARHDGPLHPALFDLLERVALGLLGDLRDSLVEASQ
jgi:hypothetical protein